MNVNFEAFIATFRDVEFFLVCLNPGIDTVFTGACPDELELLSGEGYWSITSRAPQTGRGLMCSTSAGMMMFRGYEADLGVHSYSEAFIKDQIVDPSMLKNGVFSYIRVGKLGASSLIRSDALGVAPFFYRAIPGGGYLFASHPQLIRLETDEVDLTSWMSMIQNGFCYGDKTFYKDVHRVPGGVEFVVSRSGLERRPWFDINTLPNGEKPIDDNAFELVENEYVNSLTKLLALGAPRILPFSSGYDSRRFFATMKEKGVEFQAVTCQTFHRKNGRDYDIDSLFAPKIAKSFGVDCLLLPASPLAEYCSDSLRRMTLIGTETFDHGWAIPLMNWLAKQPMSIVFDGLAGDTLGNSGYEFNGLHEDPSQDVEILARETVSLEKFSHLSGLFPSSAEFLRQYRTHLEHYPNNLNGAELAFLQGRTRRCISPWITMMHPPGQVIVFPYLDLNFVRATLEYHPAEKYKWFFQKECLKRSYPAYFDFLGSRNLPKNMTPLSIRRTQAYDRQAEEFAYGNILVVLSALKYLTFSNKMLLLLAAVFAPLRRRRSWLILPLLLMVKIHRTNLGFIEVSR